MLQFLINHGYASVIVTIIIMVLHIMTDEILLLIIIPITLVAAIFDWIFLRPIRINRKADKAVEEMLKRSKDDQKKVNK